MKAAQDTIAAKSKARLNGLVRNTLLVAALVTSAATVHAQTFESVGVRARGLGGAFVAVGSDSSATWWNPAALAAGQFLDVSVAGARDHHRDSWGAAMALPMLGVSYYRLHITEIRPFHSTDQIDIGRQDTQAPVSTASHGAHQLGFSLVHSVASGVHVGTTLKAVRVGTDRGSVGRFDADLGALIVHRSIRVGAAVRNVLTPTFGSTGVRLPREFRIGGAWDGQATGAWPVLVAVDADVSKYDAGGRTRRMVAVGAERWSGRRRVGLRAGGRVNTVGGHESALAAGASLALTSLMYVEGEVTRGGASADRGWSVGARVTF